MTINLGIDLFAEASLEIADQAPEAHVTLRAQDQGAEQTFGWGEIDTVAVPPQLELHLKLLRHFVRLKARAGAPAGHEAITLSTRAKSPAGAGLGGSSTLSIAIIGTLAAWTGGKSERSDDPDRLVEIARDVETTVIKVPAGLQDYYGAVHGGLQSLRWGTATHQRVGLPLEVLKGVEERVMLFYSGQSRNSGINNWALYKSFIDRTGETRAQFERILAATHQLETCLKLGDWDGAGRAIAAEWETRKKLAPGITTPEIDQAFAAAIEEGATAGKICGAGGGGCFFVWIPSGDFAIKAKVRKRLEKIAGIRNLGFEAVPRGLEVKVHRA